MSPDTVTHRLSARQEMSRIKNFTRSFPVPPILRDPLRRGRVRMPRPEGKTVFFHPPKCGGSSVTHAFSRAYAHSGHISPNALFYLNSGASRRAAETFDTRLESVRETILSYALEHPGTEVILGHFHYSEELFANMSGRRALVTLLRHPVDRFLSQYYYNRYKSQREHFAIDLDIEEWIWTDKAHGAGQSFTRMFVGERNLKRAISDRNATDAQYNEAVDRAIANLETFDVVEDLSRVNEFFAHLSHLCSLKLEISHRNKSPKDNYPKFEEHAPEVRERIMSLCEGDLRIYRHFIKS